MWEYVGGAQPRAPPSFGDPKNILADKTVCTEEDVLHVEDLPHFGNRLSQRHSELLLSYLTVPYMRIPLVVNFFADQTHVMALASDALQELVDACLFEPGSWSSQPSPTVAVDHAVGWNSTGTVPWSLFLIYFQFVQVNVLTF